MALYFKDIPSSIDFYRGIFLYFTPVCSPAHSKLHDLRNTVLDCNETRTHNQPLSSLTNTQSFSQTGQMTELCCEHLFLQYIWLYVYVTYVFQSESTTYIHLNVKEHLAQNRSKNLKTRTQNHLVCKQTLNHLAKLANMIRLCCEYLSVRCIWLFVLIMSSTRFRVNPHSIFTWLLRNSLLETGAKSEVAVT